MWIKNIYTKSKINNYIKFSSILFLPPFLLSFHLPPSPLNSSLYFSLFSHFISPVAPRITDPPQNLTINQTSNATFSCTAEASPRPSITWSRGFTQLTQTNDTLITEAVQDGQVISTLTLVTPNYTQAQNYTCTASNILGSDEAQAYLVVQGKLCLRCSEVLYHSTCLSSQYYWMWPVPGPLTSLMRQTRSHSSAQPEVSLARSSPGIGMGHSSPMKLTVASQKKNQLWLMMGK